MRKTVGLVSFAILLAVGCSSSDDSSNAGNGTGDGGSSSDGGSTTQGDGSTSGGEGGTTSTGIASKYPGDVGIENDPAFVWGENFEEASVSDLDARYDSTNNPSGITFDTDLPAKSQGKASGKFTAGGANSATDLYKKLSDTGYDELFVRYYAKYQANAMWHHTSVWIGGYNPPIAYPDPQAGLKPNGDDRFAVALEPVYGVGAPHPEMDFYDYWMNMHSWMDVPSGDTAYYGNAVIHQASLVVDDDQWMCIELHVKVNSDVTSSAGGELGIWKNDVSVQQFSSTAPLGYWIKDKFCPEGADSTECTDYPPASGTTMIPLDLQWRNTDALKLNYFWPQNYITDASTGVVHFDDMIVATSRIGCLD
ncbi:MAG: hypothetical protein ACRELY_32855 [Polyangiaceae bacterium]